ncbi:glycosyltransferase family 2 protein [Cupriavidus sp. UYPR2.512]|uniref:glycosyltransferase family 2 protein n=1 Tax=Cupriavidus sp. UYPR2.512 TaxID=1080187 RepID=UPI000360B6B7|nr:glycosyltransferase family 2 protein [Cupriavidus sp. UYPR2.512]UIF85431.1 glycosyltransferase family 2 protein [Cupriavidus necator]
MKSNVLAIAIPTYNRPEILEENLRQLLPDLLATNVPVYISDDSTNESTGQIIEELSKEYPYFYYTRNQPGLGHDYNCISTLLTPSENYVWYLGDSLQVAEGYLQKALMLAETGSYDFILVNAHCGDAAERSIEEMHDFLLDHAWYLTMTGATIYSRRVIDIACNKDLAARFRNFPQLAIILDYCRNHPAARAYWMGSPGLRTSSKKSSYWSTKAINVFALDWINLIDGFPDYLSRNERDSVIKSHSRNTYTFKIGHLLRLRMNGGLDFQRARQFAAQLRRTSYTPYWLLTMVATLPLPLCTVIIKLLDFRQASRSRSS